MRMVLITVMVAGICATTSAGRLFATCDQFCSLCAGDPVFVQEDHRDVMSLLRARAIFNAQRKSSNEAAQMSLPREQAKEGSATSGKVQ